MGETTKAYERRLAEGWFDRYAPSQWPGIDIGCQRDAINHTFRRWDLIRGDGDATHMEGVPDNTFQTVYASHILEHLDDPINAIKNWYRILRPTGYLIIVVPHRDLYERKKELPSRWNGEHKTYWLPDTDEAPCTLSVRRVINEALVYRDIYITVRSDGWIPMSQEVHACGEYSIEAIVQKL